MTGNKDAFFEQVHEREFRSLGYGDLATRTERMSMVDVEDVDIRAQVTTNYDLPVPILTACMNCISEDPMGIAMGEEGGAAIIHHVNTPDEQAKMVRNVRRWLNGIIRDPELAYEDQTIAQVLDSLQNRNSGRFKTIPVTDREGRCVGLMDKAGFQLFEPDTLIKDAMHPLGSPAVPIGDANLSPHEAFVRMRDDRISLLLLLDDARRIGGLCLVKDIVRLERSNPMRYSVNENGQLITFASVPTLVEEALERVRKMRDVLDVVVIDTSHGEHYHAVDTLKALKEANLGPDIVAGNISTWQTAEQIAHLEPDAMSVGQGPGQICLSSDRLGFGTAQASAIYEVSQGVRKAGKEIPIIADGGIKEPADIVKAFALGATAVKVGRLVAGTPETPVPIQYEEDGRAYREYWGMGSKKAQEMFAAARARYNNFGPLRRIFVEGIVERVSLRPPVSEVISENVLGTRMSMMSKGMPNIAELQAHVSFMRGGNSKR